MAFLVSWDEMAAMPLNKRAFTQGCKNIFIEGAETQKRISGDTV